MATKYYATPDSFAGKSLSQLQSEGQLLGRADVLGGLIGVEQNQPLKQGQTFAINNWDPGSAELQWLDKSFGAGLSPTQQLAEKQKGEQSAFLDRFKTGLNDTRAALETELGLPGLRQNAFTAGQTARDVSRQVQDVPQNQQVIAKQVGISAPRLAQRTAAETVKLQPSLESANRALQDTTAAQQFGEGQYTQRLSDFTQPYQLEASMLSESLAREFSGYTQQVQNDLSLTMQKISNQQAVSLAELQQANAMAQKEQDYLNQVKLNQSNASLGTSSQVNLEQQLKNLGLGSYYQKPQALGSGAGNGW